MCGGHPMQHEARRSDDAVAAFLLHSGQPGQKLVGDVLAQPRPCGSRCPGISRTCASPYGVLPSRRKRWIEKRATAASWILPRLWSESRDLHEVAVRVDHAPRHQIVQRRAPQHRLLAAGVHGDVAADAGRIRGRRIDREHQALRLGRLHHPPGDHARAASDGRHRLRPTPADAQVLDAAELVELLGVDDCRVALTAAPRRRCSRFRPRAG